MNPRALALEAIAWLLTYAVHSTILLAAAWLVTAKLARSERAREALWKLALVGGVATASVQRFFELEPRAASFRLERASPVVSTDPSTEPELLAGVEGELHALGYQFDAPVAEVEPGFAGPEIDPPEVPGTTGEEIPFFARVQGFLRGIDWTSFAFLAWLAGGAAVTLLFSLAAARLRDRLAGRSRLRGGQLFERFEALRRAAGVRRPVRLMLSPRLRAPVALGTLFPEICLPPRALRELGPEEQEAMLAHELAHVARFDPLWLAICRWTETLFFFQPLNRIARTRLDDAAEILCDEQAVRWTSNRLGLARCLAEVAGWIVEERRALLACGMAGSRSRLSDRVTRILSVTSEPEHAPGWIAPIAGLAFAATVLLAPGFSSPAAIAAESAVMPPAPEPLEASTSEEVVHARSQDAASSETMLARDALPPSPRAALASIQADLQAQFARLSDELLVLRTDIDEHSTVPGELHSRLRAIEERAAGMREKKGRIDALLSRWMMGNEPKTTIDEMDRSQQGDNR